MGQLTSQIAQRAGVIFRTFQTIYLQTIRDILVGQRRRLRFGCFTTVLNPPRFAVFVMHVQPLYPFAA
jgi:hypothetical protein